MLLCVATMRRRAGEPLESAISPTLLEALSLASGVLLQACQAVGLESTTATQGAFLIQTTALFTPLIAGVTGSAISGTVWLATALVLV